MNALGDRRISRTRSFSRGAEWPNRDYPCADPRCCCGCQPPASSVRSNEVGSAPDRCRGVPAPGVGRYQLATPDDLGDAALECRLYPALRPRPRTGVAAGLAGVHRELRRKGVTLQLCGEYRATHPDGYSRSRFCEMYRALGSRLRRNDAARRTWPARSCSSIMPARRSTF